MLKRKSKLYRHVSILFSHTSLDSWIVFGSFGRSNPLSECILDRRAGLAEQQLGKPWKDRKASSYRPTKIVSDLTCSAAFCWVTYAILTISPTFDTFDAEASDPVWNLPCGVSDFVSLSPIDVIKRCPTIAFTRAP